MPFKEGGGGAPGPTGPGGAQTQIYYTADTPGAGTGSDNDYALVYDGENAGDWYKKLSGIWTLQADFMSTGSNVVNDDLTSAANRLQTLAGYTFTWQTDTSYRVGDVTGSKYLDIDSSDRVDAIGLIVAAEGLVVRQVGDIQEVLVVAHESQIDDYQIKLPADLPPVGEVHTVRIDEFGNVTTVLASETDTNIVASDLPAATAPRTVTFGAHAFTWDTDATFDVGDPAGMRVLIDVPNTTLDVVSGTAQADGFVAKDQGYLELREQAGSGVNHFRMIAADSMSADFTMKWFAAKPPTGEIHNIRVDTNGVASTKTIFYPWLPAARTLVKSDIPGSPPQPVSASLGGVTMLSGQTAVLTAQSAAKDNGLWTYKGAFLNMERPEEFANGVQADQCVVRIQEGTSANQQWSQSQTAIVGTDPQTWVQGLPGSGGGDGVMIHGDWDVTGTPKLPAANAGDWIEILIGGTVGAKTFVTGQWYKANQDTAGGDGSPFDTHWDKKRDASAAIGDGRFTVTVTSHTFGAEGDDEMLYNIPRGVKYTGIPSAGTVVQAKLAGPAMDHYLLEVVDNTHLVLISLADSPGVRQTISTSRPPPYDYGDNDESEFLYLQSDGSEGTAATGIRLFQVTGSEGTPPDEEANELTLFYDGFDAGSSGAGDDLGDHTATEIIKAGTFGIQFAAAGQDIIGSGSGIIYDSEAGDTHKFQLNSTDVLTISSTTIDLEGLVLRFGEANQDITGSATGMIYDSPTGDSHDFQINSVSEAVIDGTGLSLTTDLAIAHGGTGQSTAQLAINALSDVASATDEYVLTKDTATGDAVYKAIPAASGDNLGNHTATEIIKSSTFGVRFAITGQEIIGTALVGMVYDTPAGEEHKFQIGGADELTVGASGIVLATDLAIAYGGTGQSTAQLAINALSDVASATDEYVLTKDTASGDAIYKAIPAASGDNLGNHTATEIIKAGAFGIQFAAAGQDIIGTGTGIIYDSEAGDTHKFQLDSTDVLTISSTTIDLEGLILRFSEANQDITGSATGIVYDTPAGDTHTMQVAGTDVITFSAADVTSDVDLIVSTTGFIRVPVGTTGERPGAPQDGDVRVNTTDGNYEGYRGGAWRDLETAGAGDNLGDHTATQNLSMAGFNITVAGIALGDNTISGTMAQFDAAATDGSFAFVGGAHHDGFSDFVSNEHVDHTAVTLTLTGRTNEVEVVGDAGDISVSRSWTIGIRNNPIIPGNGAMTVPVGSTAQQPAGLNGDLRYDSDTGKLRTKENDAWVDVIQAGVGDDLGDHTATEIIKAETFGIQFSEAGQDIIGSATGMVYDTPTGDSHDFQINSVSEAVIDATGLSLTTDLAIAHGGTGQSTAQLAINALSDVASATNEHVLTKDTATGDAVYKAVPEVTDDIWWKTCEDQGTLSGVGNTTQVDWSGGLGQHYDIIDDTNLTINLAGAPPSCRFVVLEVTQDGVGGHKLSIGTGSLVDPNGELIIGSKLPINLRPNGKTALVFYWDDSHYVFIPTHRQKSLALNLSEESTAVGVGDKAAFRVGEDLHGKALVYVGAAVGDTASTSGKPTIEVERARGNRSYDSMFLTLLTIDAEALDSMGASVPAVIDAATDDLLEGDLIRARVTGAGTGTEGMFVTLTFA